MRLDMPTGDQNGAFWGRGGILYIIVGLWLLARSQTSDRADHHR